MALRYASAVLRGDPDVCLAACAASPQALYYCSEALRDDAVFVAAAVAAGSGACLRCDLPSKYRHPLITLVVLSVKASLYYLGSRTSDQVASCEVLRAVMLTYVCARAHGRHASAAVRAVRAVVLAAVVSDWTSLGYAADALRRDADLVNPCACLHTTGPLTCQIILQCC